MRIGIDLMGSDSSPQELFEGVLLAVEKLKGSTTLVCYATPESIKKFPISEDGLVHLHPVETAIYMDENPLLAVRKKKNASLVAGLRDLKEKKLDAFVTAGNTGALMTASRVILKTLPNIQRPALLALLPTKKGAASLIDAGGNASSHIDALLQYACMGAIYQRTLFNLKQPTVGLLNMGPEVQKGTLFHRELYLALEKFSESPDSIFVFKGNIEAREIFEGSVDLIVTEGFTGNILLKAIEGTASFMMSCLSNAQKGEIADSFQQLFDYAQYPGAWVCGVNEIVLKCHGNASKNSICHSIEHAKKLVEKKLLSQLSL